MSALTQQMAFQRIRKQFRRIGKSPIITQSFLRLEQDISATSTLYEFPVLEGESITTTQKPSEVRLNMNDSFFAESCALYIATPTSAIASDYRLESYPNETILGAGNFQQYFNLYNGVVRVSINNTEVLKYDAVKHYYCPQTQRINAGANQVFDELDARINGTYFINPNIMFSGSKSNKISIELPQAITTVAEFSRIILIWRGALAQNSSAFQQ